MQFGWMTVDSSVFLDGLKSLILLVSVILIRTLVVRGISRNHALSMEDKRRWVVTTRNSMVFVILIGFVVTFGKVAEVSIGGLRVLPDLAGMSIYVLMAVVLLWRPEGIFGRRLK
jgi:ABC-type xylose transport system permease subunit